MAGTSSTLFSDRLFLRQLKFGGNWIHIIFHGIVMEIWRELAPHYFLADCFGGSSDLAGTDFTLFSDRFFGGSSNLAGTGSTLFSDRMFLRQLTFGRNWLHIFFRWIVLEIWRELAPHYFLADCFRGSSDLAGTGSK